MERGIDTEIGRERRVEARIDTEREREKSGRRDKERKDTEDKDVERESLFVNLSFISIYSIRCHTIWMLHHSSNSYFSQQIFSFLL